MFDNFVFQASSFDSVPEGTYNSEFIGTEEIASKYGDDGKAIAWRFKILDNGNAGKVVSKVSGTKPTPKNKCGKTLIALLGKTPGVGESVSVKDCVGKRYALQVVKNPNGDGTIIENVFRLP
jgi:hypothetical protein